MSLRSVDEPGTQDDSSRKRMVRVIITEDQQLYAVWHVQRGKRRRELTIQVGPALRDNIIARPAFQTMLDNIADNTKGNVNI